MLEEGSLSRSFDLVFGVEAIYLLLHNLAHRVGHVTHTIKLLLIFGLVRALVVF